MPMTIPLNKAKTHLSSIGRIVRTTGATYVVTVRNEPAFTIAPVETEKPRKSKTAGMLHAYASAEARAKEEGAWQRAVEDKYAHPARR